MSRDIPAKKRQAQPVQLKGDGEIENMNHQEERSVADWTLMVYVGATAVLDSFAVESLKEMKRAASDGVIVAAQFDASGHDKIRRLIFDGTGERDASIKNNVVESFVPNNNKTPSDFLKEFILWAYARPDCQAKHYCLILWTDGSLSAAPPTDRDSQEVIDNRRRQNFLLPVELRLALEEVRSKTGRNKFEIIGMDACNMTMVEDVYELRECTDFLIASEEEVPDRSLPYEQLLPLFREHKDDTVAICRMIAREYKQAYQDYISNKSTQFRKVTLSCLQPVHIINVVGPLDELAQALLSAVEQDAGIHQAICLARDKAKSFVAGLFADIFDFCHHLSKELARQNIVNRKIESACAKVCNAISTPGAQGLVVKEGTVGPQSQLVVENQTSEPHRCHGLSIYFPNSTAVEREEFDQFNNKAKGSTTLLNKSRGEGIGQIEDYYQTLQLAKNTHWGEFIAFGWSRCLIRRLINEKKINEKKSLELDIRYSAQQCAIHLESYLSQLEKKCQGCKEKSAGLSGWGPLSSRYASSEGIFPVSAGTQG